MELAEPVRCRCGGEPENIIVDTGSYRVYYAVKCKKCGIQTSPQVAELFAIEAWNKTMGAERKKGHWVKVSGYFTPGGDPVWRCSECGKGMHVYGIEANSYNTDYADGQWVSCPNCGADMRGDYE